MRISARSKLGYWTVRFQAFLREYFRGRRILRMTVAHLTGAVREHKRSGTAPEGIGAQDRRADARGRYAAGALSLNTALDVGMQVADRAGRRAYRGHHPPRHQTRQHLHRAARSRESARFRPRQERAGHTAGGRDHDCRHAAGCRDGNSRLHGAGAGPRRGRGSPRRHLELRPGSLRNGQGDAAPAGRPAARRGVAGVGAHRLEVSRD